MKTPKQNWQTAGRHHPCDPGERPPSAGILNDKEEPVAKVKFCSRLFGAIGSVSRVLYLTVIYLDPGLLLGSSHTSWGRPGQPVVPTHGVAPDRVYSTPMFPWGGCALPHLFTLTSREGGGISLLTCPRVTPGGRLLSYASPCGARTFNSRGAFRPPPAAVRPGRGPIVADFSGIVKTFSPQPAIRGSRSKAACKLPAKWLY